jgi:hypothetical protein
MFSYFSLVPPQLKQIQEDLFLVFLSKVSSFLVQNKLVTHRGTELWRDSHMW